MHADQIPIPEPCNEDWSAMTGEEKRRFCAACDKHVHDLSAMTATEAEQTLAEDPEICVRYTVHEDGSLVHQSSRRAFFKAAAGALLLGTTPAIAASLAAPSDDEEGLLHTLKDRFLAWWNGEPEGCPPPEAEVLGFPDLRIDPPPPEPPTLIPELDASPPEPPAPTIIRMGKRVSQPTMGVPRRSPPSE